MRRATWVKAATLLVCLALLGGSVTAGELADLHRELVGSGASQSADPTVPQAPGVPGVPGVTLAPLPRREPLPAIERVGYEASRCRGFCEAFTVIISADGSFEYVGEANVERLGRHVGRLDSYAVEQLLRFVDAIDYAALSDTYTSPLADVQTTYTMVDYASGEVKVVQDQGGTAPVTVWALGRLIRSMLEDAAWE